MPCSMLHRLGTGLPCTAAPSHTAAPAHATHIRQHRRQPHQGRACATATAAPPSPSSASATPPPPAAHAPAEAVPHKPAAGATAPSRPPGPAKKVPTSIHEVDNGRLLGFGADLAEDHPGFGDKQYTQRRVDIARLASTHMIGKPIPRVEYSDAELHVWGRVLQQLEPLWRRHACSSFLRAYPLFGFRPDQVPQLEDVSAVLRRTTGWSIRPVAGLMHPRDFLAGLAFRTFHSTQYIRHPSNPAYTPEPDVVHELLGHVPMLADPACADLVQAIGQASLGASDADTWILTKAYWYTVEFGVVMEQGLPKAFGAGILSSYGELQNLASGVPRLVPLDPFKPLPKMSYKDGYQQTYFKLSSFQEGAALLRKFAASKQQQVATVL